MALSLSAADQQALQDMFGSAGQYNWSDLLGQVTLGTPAAGTPTLAAQNDKGFVQGSPTVAEQANTGYYTDPNTGQPSYTAPYLQSLGNDTGYVYDPQLSAAPGSVVKTLPREEWEAAQTGMLPGGTPTMAARQMAASTIQNATSGFADPFTYQAKLQGLQQAGALGGILGNNIAAASGRPLWELQNTPNLTNTQLATDLSNTMVGKPMSALTTNFLQNMLGVTPQGAAGAAGTDASPAAPTGGGVAPGPGGVVNPADGGTTVIGGTHYHLPANPLLAQNPGAATPIQDFNKLDPSSQQAYIDLQQQMPNGQQQDDFLSQMKGAAPSANFKGGALASSGI